MSRATRKEAARGPNHTYGKTGSAGPGHRARKGPACPTCNRRMRRKAKRCHACG